MNTLLMKHKPPDIDKKKWEELWYNSRYALTPLLNVLLELKGKDTITEEELEHPNLHDKLIWDASKRRIIEKIIDIMDITVDKTAK